MPPDHADIWQAIGREISAATGLPGAAMPKGEIAGGDINRAMRLELGGRSFFVKLNIAEASEMFAAEADGLAEIRSSGTLRAPEPVCFGSDHAIAFLVLEHLELARGGDAAALGAGLAAMHGVTRAEFGWHRDNTIGSTPQVNSPGSSWTDFWRDHRLGYQLRLATRHGCPPRLIDRGTRLLERFHLLFGDREPRPSLLHGDLWGGNYAYTRAGQPVIFDPAVYYGDRETDLAMTELFGGFNRSFHAAYRAAWPLDEGYPVRKPLYQLYHVLNHLNLFGGHYQSQALRLIDALLAELG